MERRIETGGARGLYRLDYFRRDLIAGLTVATVAVPQAMAYALIAGLPPEYGLYTAIITTALAALFGSSSHLVNGPTNAISLAVFSAVAALPTAAGDPHHIQAVCALALLVGGIQVLIALLKLGDLTRYVSESVILGFMAGAGILVALGQVDNLLGLAPRDHGEPYFLYRLGQTLSHWRETNPVAMAVGLGTAVLIVGLRRLGARLSIQVPDYLLALLAASAAVGVLSGFAADGRRPVPMIAEIAGHLPLPAVPEIRSDWLRPLPGSALAIALLGLLESLAIAKSISARTRQPLDFNRQCLAEGLANLGGGLFRCMPGSGSLTRSAINFQAGAATRAAAFLSAVVVAAILLAFAPWTRFVPRAALAGILLVTAWRIVDRQRLAYCIRASRFDAAIALGTALAAIFISVEFSILIGVFLSFLFFVPRAARVQASELVLSAERVLRERQPDDPQCTKMAILSLEGELFFGAAPDLDEHLAALALRAEQGVRIIVLRLKRARNPDMVCLERLQRFLEDMMARNVTVLLCGVREDFAQALRNLRFQRWMPPDCIFLEEAAVFSSTLRAVRRAYELLGNDRCPTCPRPREEEDKGGWYYMI
jgi:SulP family sulfate permease